jgi:hypothetical protein
MRPSQPIPPVADHRRSGVRSWVARRPLTALLILVFGLSWLILTIPILASRHLILGEVIHRDICHGRALLVMLPAVLFVT